ncbi:MAG: methyltransferase domain-containing protein [Candidatus Omnitrophica bacterium]|nr:methyltransferase domain-containing protein [Candidatus Omnitrophota bacterium]
MCTLNCFKWVGANLSVDEVIGKRVIEIGAYDVNGSLRYVVEMLKPAKYLGVDIIPGPGVDLICPAEKLVEKFGQESFDVVIVTCVLEHIRDWRSAVSNIKRICSPNGIMLIFVPSNYFYHSFPNDFWRYSQNDIRYIFADCEILNIGEDPNRPSNVYAKIKKQTNFREIDLSGYPLYSIVVNRKVKDITGQDLNSLYFKFVVFKSRARESILNIGHSIISRL